MAKYTIISDIGKGLLAMLRDQLVPDPVDKSESIGICEPKNRGGYVVGIHPYDVKEYRNEREGMPTNLPNGAKQEAPAMVELKYMISISSSADLESKAFDEAKIIGRIIQIFKDNQTIPARYMPYNAGMPPENVPINVLPIEMDEKMKIWSMFGETYKMSIFYLVGPVAIDSAKITKPKTRVETFELGSDQFVSRKEIKFETHVKEEDIYDEYSQPKEDDDQAENDEDLGLDEEESEEGEEDFGLDEEENEEGEENFGLDEDESKEDQEDFSLSEDENEESEEDFDIDSMDFGEDEE